MGKESVSDPARLTLADIEVTWPRPFVPEGHGECRASGRDIARLLYEAAFVRRSPGSSEEATDTAPNLLRGLAALVFPDAGTPIADIDADRRLFLADALDTMAARIHAEKLDYDEAATRFTVCLRPNGGRS